MARMSAKAGEEWAAKLSALNDGALEVCQKALNEGAGVIADAIRQRIPGLPEDTGITKRGLADGLGISPMREDGGYYNVKVGFDGYNERGIANALMARIMESGTSREQKHPFVRPAVNASKKRAQEVMQETIDSECARIMGH